ncbi:MAG: hypothetical protein KA771_05355 [Spirochaetales bacterium]|nr:hypothetical protein [Spirochaetales bacterium]
MKRFWIIGILLVVLIGAGFFIGWVQRSIPPGNWAIGFSKTGGWESAVWEPGEFQWRWERLIPGNYSLYLFPVEVYPLSVVVKGELPSGTVYASVLEGLPSFMYEISIDLQFSFRKETFPELVKTEGLLPANLNQWVENKKQEIQQTLSIRIQETILSRLEASVPGSWQEACKTLVEQVWEERFSTFSLQSYTISFIQVPDYDLYKKGKELYLAVEEGKKETLVMESKKHTIESMAEERRLESLKKYGELLKSYPLLLEFLAIEKLEKIDLSELKEFRQRAVQE